MIALASIIILGFIARATFQTNAQAQSAARDVAALQQQTDALNRRVEEIKIALTPDQRRTLKSAHVLVDRKRFSWSRLLADLEAALPGNIRVSRISVKDIGAEGDRTVAELDLTVASKNPATVTQMIEDMDREGIFHAELVSQNPQRGKGESGAEYEMNVHYIPRAGTPIALTERSSHPLDTAGDGSKTR